MAKEAFTVLFEKQADGANKFDGTKTEFTKAEAEKKHGKLKEITVILGAPEQVSFIEIEAESAEQAAIAARVLVGAKAAEGELLVGKSSGFAKAKPF